jgi:hypothetical protein
MEINLLKNGKRRGKMPKISKKRFIVYRLEYF